MDQDNNIKNETLNNNNNNINNNNNNNSIKSKMKMNKLDLNKINENKQNNQNRQNIKEEILKYEYVISKIDDNIFISGGIPTECYQKLKESYITHIINISSNYKNSFVDIEYLNFDINDTPNDDISACFDETIRFIKEAHKNNCAVLIHCDRGISRSTTLCCLWLMYSKGYDFDKAFEIIKANRSIADPNCGFIIQLKNWYANKINSQNSPIPVQNVPQKVNCTQESITENL